MTLFFLVLRQTVYFAFRKGGGAFGSCAFYIISVTLFAFALGPQAISHYATAVLCVAMLLASVTSLPLFYERDYEDGTLEQYLLQPVTLELLTLAKILGQWLAIMLPILLLSPLMAVLCNLSADAMGASLLRLLLASPTIIAIASIASALTLGVRRGGLLQALVMLPLSVPVLIFAASDNGQGAVWLLAGLAFAALPLSCFVSAALIHSSQE